MNIPMPAQATASCAAINASRLREAAQSQIVRSFCAHLGGGPEPSDGELILFARLAASEMRLKRRLVSIVSEHDGRAAVRWER